MGCRRPTGGVFTYVSSDRVTLRAFPVATPRGRSSSSHEGERSFSTNVPRILIICLVALITELVFLEALKKRFRALSSKMTCSEKKAQTHENLSSALQKTFNFIRKKRNSSS